MSKCILVFYETNSLFKISNSRSFWLFDQVYFLFEMKFVWIAQFLYKKHSNYANSAICISTIFISKTNWDSKQLRMSLVSWKRSESLKVIGEIDCWEDWKSEWKSPYWSAAATFFSNIFLFFWMWCAMLKDMQKITYHAMVCTFAYFYLLWSTLSKCQKVENSIKGFFLFLTIIMQCSGLFLDIGNMLII